MGRSLSVALFVLALTPSAYLAWQGRDVPHLGSFHDDAIYLETARNLALENTYRIGTLPWTPYQTKYPPLYPLYLSIAWHITPNLADALPIALFLNWLWLPVWILGIHRLICQQGLPKPYSALPLLVALHPEVQLASTRLMSDLMFAALATWALALHNSILPAVAYLVRSAALPLTAAMALTDLLSRRWRKAAWTIFLSLVPILGWSLWISAHRHPATTMLERYYTDYLSYQFEAVPLASLPAHVYQQLDPYIAALSRMLLLHFGDTLGWVMVSRLAAIAAISGIIRLMRRGLLHAYGIYALLSTAMMLVWYFPPDPRAMLPLTPLLLLGLAVEVECFTNVIRVAWSRRGAERLFAGVCAGLCLLLPFAMTANGVQSLLTNGPAVFAMERRFLAEARPAYRWVEANTPQSTRFFAIEDPAFALYTNRRALRIPQLDEIFVTSPSQKLAPSPHTLAAMKRFQLQCLFVSIKNFNPNPQNPYQPLDLDLEGTGLESVYRSRSELCACKPL